MNKILITGGTGFVGANFARRLLREGNEVHLIIRESSDLWRINDIQEKLFLHTADITNKVAVNDVFKTVAPQIVLHFAAHGAGVAKDRNDTEGTTAINLLGTVHLVDAFAEFGGRCFINVGSSSEYGEKDHPISEDDILAPESLYGITKAAGTLYCSNLAKQKDLPITTLRLFSPFGYFEGDGRLMPAIIKAALGEGKFEAPSPDI
ncbi:MAG: NAD-dependent epimerase/dehydratase family protein, partial [Patescibacteria group bacterium]